MAYFESDKYYRYTNLNTTAYFRGGEASIWGVTNSSLKDYYDQTFNPIMPNQSLDDYIAAKIASGGTCNGLDLMSYGAAWRPSQITKGLSVAQSDGRTMIERLTDSSKNRQLITGDLGQLATWDSIDQWSSAQTPTGFDLVIARPFGGATHLMFNSAKGLVLLNRLYQLLSPNNSLALLQYKLPIGVDQTCFEDWLKRNNQAGIDIKSQFSADFFHNLLMINKSNSSPEELML